MMNDQKWGADDLGEDFERVYVSPGRALGDLTLMYAELVWLAQLEAARQSMLKAIERAGRSVPEAGDTSVSEYWERQLNAERGSWQCSLDRLSETLRIHHLYGKQVSKWLAGTASSLEQTAATS